MTKQEFEMKAAEILDMIESRLARKGDEYANDPDRFINFKWITQLDGYGTPEQKLLTLFNKHQSVISYKWIVDGILPSIDELYERVIDNIVYYIILLNILEEKIHMVKENGN